MFPFFSGSATRHHAMCRYRLGMVANPVDVTGPAQRPRLPAEREINAGMSGFNAGVVNFLKGEREFELGLLCLVVVRTLKLPLYLYRHNDTSNTIGRWLFDDFNFSASCSAQKTEQQQQQQQAAAEQQQSSSIKFLHVCCHASTAIRYEYECDTSQQELFLLLCCIIFTLLFYVSCPRSKAVWFRTGVVRAIDCCIQQ